MLNGVKVKIFNLVTGLHFFEKYIFLVKAKTKPDLKKLKWFFQVKLKI